MAGSTGTVGKDTQSPEENLYKDLPFTNQTNRHGFFSLEYRDNIESKYKHNASKSYLRHRN